MFRRLIELFFLAANHAAIHKKNIPGFDVSQDALSDLASTTSLLKIYTKLDRDVELRKYIFAALELQADTPFPRITPKILLGDIMDDDYYPTMAPVVYLANDAPDNIKTFYRNVGALYGVKVDEYSLCHPARGNQDLSIGCMEK